MGSVPARSSEPTSPLTAEVIERSLGSDSFIRRVVAFETIDSTNNYAKNLIQGETLPVLIVAEEQTQGRGRFGRRWISEKGKNLTFSLVVQSQFPNDRIGALPLCVAESVATAVELCASVSIKTKWPNDLLVEKKKVCGILMESVLVRQKLHALVIGIGLNVNQETFPHDLKAGSLSLSVGNPLNRLPLLSEIVGRLDWLGRPISATDLDEKLRQWRRRCDMLGKMVRVQQGNAILSGIAKGIAEDGGLLIDAHGVEQKILAGSVRVLEVG